MSANRAKRGALVINFNSPELNHAASALAATHHLHAYVRLYANLQRPWERALRAAPGLSRIYTTTFGRRRLPSDLPSRFVREAGFLYDFCGVLIGRMGPSWGRVARGLHWSAQRAVGAKAARF